MENDVLLDHLVASAVWWDALDAIEDGRIDGDQFEATTEWTNAADEVYCFQALADSYPEQWVW